MTFFVKRICDLERLSKKCTVGFTPKAEALLEVLQRIEPRLKAKGWSIKIYNYGTKSIKWVFNLPGTPRRVCREVEIIPIAHYPISAENSALLKKIFVIDTDQKVAKDKP